MLASGLWAAAPTSAVSAESPSDPQATALITGKLDPWRDRIDFRDVTLAINGTPAELDNTGRYTARVPHADTYQLQASGSGIFTMVQTFGPEELRDAACACLAVPEIELVARKAGRIEVFLGGDSMAGRRYLDPAKGKRATVSRANIEADLAALFRPMQPYFVPSDVASVNLETVLADAVPGGSPNKLIVFYSPTALAGALKAAGIDYVSLGNNHTYDYLDAGLDLTETSLDKAGVLRSGSGKDLNSAAAAARLDMGSNRLSLHGFVGWSGYFKPNLVAGPGKGGAMHGNDLNIAAAMERERRAGRAPIVQLHTGSEYADEPTEFGVKRMRLAVEEGAALVASHHPHVTQGFEVYRDRLIAYSMGNFMFDQNFVETMISYTLKVWMDNGKVIRAEVIPIQILDYRPVPAVGSMREALLRRIFALSARRDTFFRMSGGHAVVRFDRGESRLREGAECVPDGNGIVRRQFSLAAPFAACRLPEGGKFGRDLMMRGDFENAAYDVAVDRTWGTRKASYEIRREAGGNHYLSLLPQVPGVPAVLFTDPYFRKVTGEHYSLVADVKVDRAATIELAVKPRQGEGEKATSPWKGGIPAGKVELEPAPGWQRIRIDFSRKLEAGKEPAPLRPILSVTYKQGKAAGVLPVLFDNMSFVEWEARPEAELPPGERWLWTHWARVAG
jgi:poly-gamma-glutamate capsule biosynthesis protein CapA/YwtB (metallophosphatase superfamily)